MEGIQLLEDKVLNYVSKLGPKQEEETFQTYCDLNRPDATSNQKYGHVVKNVLAISEVLNSCGFEGEYFHIGGYATLLHLTDVLGINGVERWRGSHDIDIVTRQRGLTNILRNTFNVESECKSNFECKKKLEMRDQETNHPIGVDLYFPENGQVKIDGYRLPERIFSDSKISELFGVKVPIPKIHDLMAMKLSVHCSQSGMPREKDISDIINLLGCLERKTGFCNKYPCVNGKVLYLKKKLDQRDEELFPRLIDVVNLRNYGQMVLIHPSQDMKKTLRLHK